MDIQEKARGKMNWFEKILHQVPGFKGYYEKEFRRDADRLQREFIAGQLHEAGRGLNEAIQAVSRRKDLALLTDYDLLSKRLQKVGSEVLYADRGYSGFFDLIKVRAGDLDAIYRLDGEMIELAVRFCAAIREMAAAPAAPPRFGALAEELSRIEAMLARRTDLLKGYRE
jgi:hypothetical protein